MKKTGKQNLLKEVSSIKLLVLDVDGVLTDGSLILDENGKEYKKFHVRDGQGLVMLLGTGCNIAVITARSSKIVAERMRELGIKYVYQGTKHKGAKLTELMNELSLEKNEVAYAGDDLIDLPAMTKVGFPIAVADAHYEVKKHASMVTDNLGGKGAVREICEFIMHANGSFDKCIESYLSC